MIDGVRYCRFGYANVFKDGIWLNKALAKPEWFALHSWIVNHELGHGSGLVDFKHDFQDYFAKPQEVSKQYFKFFFTHPSSWVQVMPVLLHKSTETGEWGLYWDLYRLAWLAGLTVFTALFMWAGTW